MMVPVVWAKVGSEKGRQMGQGEVQVRAAWLIVA